MPNDRKEIQIAAHDDQIIVNLNDLAGVQDLLNSSGVSWERIEKCTRLRLALITAGRPGQESPLATRTARLFPSWTG